MDNTDKKIQAKYPKPWFKKKKFKNPSRMDGLTEKKKEYWLKLHSIV